MGPVLLLSFLRLGSEAPRPSRLALLCCPGELLGSSTRLLQLVTGTDSSPALLAPGPAFSPATGGKGWIGGIECLPSLLLPGPHHHMKCGVGPDLHSHILVHLPLSIGSALLCCPGMGQGPLPRVLQLVTGKVSSSRPTHQCLPGEAQLYCALCNPSEIHAESCSRWEGGLVLLPSGIVDLRIAFPTATGDGVYFSSSPKPPYDRSGICPDLLLIF